MSMYVEILTNALDDWIDGPTGTALVNDALDRRADLLKLGSQHDDSAYVSVASEIAYDRSLINLCQAHGIEVCMTNFAYPGQERARLERKLKDLGLDLAALDPQKLSS